MTRTSLLQRIADRQRILTEGSVYELLRRDPRISFDPAIAHAGLIYRADTRAVLAETHRTYLRIAAESGLPILAFTDTWRASAARVAESAWRGRAVNRDNVLFLREVAAETGATVFVAGMSGPHGDGYRPAEAPARGEAVVLHRPQIEELAQAAPDLLFAATLPALDEALGIAEVMAATGLPWALSFVVRPSGALLDGTSLAEAIRTLDANIVPNAVGFSINCVHPSIAASALRTLEPALAERIVAFQGNTSALSPEELDGQAEIQTESAAQFVTSMAGVANLVPIVGGCCGTGPAHMKALAHCFADAGQLRSLADSRNETSGS